MRNVARDSIINDETRKSRLNKQIFNPNPNIQYTLAKNSNSSIIFISSRHLLGAYSSEQFCSKAYNKASN